MDIPQLQPEDLAPPLAMLYLAKNLYFGYIHPMVQKMMNYDRVAALNKQIAELKKENKKFKSQNEQMKSRQDKNQKELRFLRNDNAMMEQIIKSAMFYHENQYLIDDYNEETGVHERHTSLPWFDNDSRYELEEFVHQDRRFANSMKRRGYDTTLYAYVRKQESHLEDIGLQKVQRNPKENRRQDKKQRRNTVPPIRLPESNEKVAVVNAN